MNKMEKLRIGVVIITYNQEDIIKRAIDSVLIQKEFGLTELVVADDCSTDGTFNMVLSYADKFPSIVKAHRNKKNLGIYGNLEKAISLINRSDIVFLSSGDDAFCDGYFKAISGFIKNQKINFKEELFSIYSDWKMIKPNGAERVFYNNLILKGLDPISLKIRELIYNRSVGVSVKVLEKFAPVTKEMGTEVAESEFDRQIQKYTQVNYYCPFIGSIYYSGIGVSTTMKSKEQLKNRIYSWQLELEDSNSKSKDKNFIKYKISRMEFSIEPSLKYFFATWYYFITSFEFKYGLKPVVVFKEFVRMTIQLFKMKRIN